jgi:hypothetical protein
MGISHFLLGVAVGIALTSFSVFLYRENLLAACGGTTALSIAGSEEPGAQDHQKRDEEPQKRVTVKINERDFTFVYGPKQTAKDLAVEFCKSQAPALGFAETLDECIGPVKEGLERHIGAEESTVDTSGQSRRLPLTINDVVYVFEYMPSMQPEFAAPRLANEFCFSEKGRLATPLGDTEGVFGVELETLQRTRLEERCVRPLQAALLDEINKGVESVIVRGS